MKRYVLILVALGLVSAPGHSYGIDSKVYEKLDVLAKVLSYVETNYIEDVDHGTLLDDSIKGLLTSLDPHTMYMPPHIYRTLRENTSGEFEGVGIEISMRDELLTVVSPIEDSPAERAGVKAGDVILKIEETPTQGMILLEAVKKLKGPRGSKVTIEFQRKGTSETYTVTLRRQKIGIKSVSSQPLEAGFGYVRIMSFQEKTGRELRRALRSVQEGFGKSPLRGLVLDLRNNPGGLLEQAIRVADFFLESGVIVSTMGRGGAFQEVKLAHKEGTWPATPMIVLVNEGTASASEIVAGALQDHKRAVVLGTQSFGKGSVQTIIDLEDGSALKVTIARYYTPDGRSIQAEGIRPDITVSEFVPPEVDVIREKDLEGHIEVSQPKPRQKKSDLRKGMGKSIDLEGDIQLRRALEYLKTWEAFKPTVSPSA